MHSVSPVLRGAVNDDPRSVLSQSIQSSETLASLSRASLELICSLHSSLLSNAVSFSITNCPHAPYRSSGLTLSIHSLSLCCLRTSKTNRASALTSHNTAQEHHRPIHSTQHSVVGTNKSQHSPSDKRVGRTQIIH
jgi:hypothetical protein